jgi:V/A-type H+-transporting ATPase subunit C
LGTIDPEELKDLVFGGHEKAMAKGHESWLIEVVKQASEMWQKEQDLGLIDCLFDKHYYQRLGRAVKRSGSKYLKKYIAMKIDMYNLKLVLRKDHIDEIKDMILSCGTVPVAFWGQNIPLNANELLARPELAAYPYLKDLASMKEEEMLTGLELAIYGHEQEQLKQSKYLFRGVDPIWGYLASREREVKMLELVLLAKTTGTQDLMAERQLVHV